MGYTIKIVRELNIPVIIQYQSHELGVFRFLMLLTPLAEVKGGPEPLEKESHEFLGSKRDDRFSNPFF